MKKLPLAAIILSLALSAPALQLVPGLPNPAAPTQASTDPLGRDTPSGTVVGFLQAAQANDYKRAASYLQLSVVRRQSQGPDLARKLKVLMDRAFVGSLRRLSTRPEGDPDSGTVDQQTVGTFSTGEADIPVLLVRVSEAGSAKIWLFSAETLSKIPEHTTTCRRTRSRTDSPAAWSKTSF